MRPALDTCMMQGPPGVAGTPGKHGEDGNPVSIVMLRCDWCMQHVDGKWMITNVTNDDIIEGIQLSTCGIDSETQLLSQLKLETTNFVGENKLILIIASCFPQ